MALEDVLVCATTYEPDPPGLDDLLAMLTSSGAAVAVFDNSTSSAGQERVRVGCAARGVVRLATGTNDGTAGALNTFLRHAETTGRTWLCYFDQDSRVEGPGFWRRVGEVADRVGPQVAAVGSSVALRAAPGTAVSRSERGGGLVPAVLLIASGTMYRVGPLTDVDGFDESLALDLVDHDACLRLRARGHQVLLDRERGIDHEIGRDSRPTRLLKVRATRHPGWRRRMMWRNSLLLVRRHVRREPRLCVRHLGGRVAETLVGAWSFRDPSYLTAALRGLRDGLRDDSGVLGLSEGGQAPRPALP